VVDHVRDLEGAVQAGIEIYMSLEASQRKWHWRCQFLRGACFVVDGGELNAARCQRIGEKIGRNKLKETICCHGISLLHSNWVLTIWLWSQV
jgi:hypothetical protein